ERGSPEVIKAIDARIASMTEKAQDASAKVYDGVVEVGEHLPRGHPRRHALAQLFDAWCRPLSSMRPATFSGLARLPWDRVQAWLDRHVPRVYQPWWTARLDALEGTWIDLERTRQRDEQEARERDARRST
ncbi:MAG: hypothetical protein AAF772_15920, partial [Acidobacteriota bacterium]